MLLSRSSKKCNKPIHSQAKKTFARRFIPVLSGTGTTVLHGISGSIGITWTDNSGSGTALATDKALVVVLNPVRAEAVYETAGSQRSTSAHEIAVPAEWLGESVEVFLGFITEDGKDVANSVYLGSVEVV